MKHERVVRATRSRMFSVTHQKNSIASNDVIGSWNANSILRLKMARVLCLVRVIQLTIIMRLALPSKQVCLDKTSLINGRNHY